MARALDPIVSETLKKYGFGKDAAWDCHGVFVVYHRVLEQIAAQAGIAFDPPQIIEAKGEQGIAAVCVVGRMGDKAIWSIGEAAPKNNKNAYPWAMAEKRAVDRVILKLIGIHGLVYSEEEADDFKTSGAPAEPAKDGSTPVPDVTTKKKKDDLHPWKGPLTKTDLMKELRKFTSDLGQCEDVSMIKSCESGYQAAIDQLKIDMPDLWDGEPDGNGFVPLKRRIEDREALLSIDPQMRKAS